MKYQEKRSVYAPGSSASRPKYLYCDVYSLEAVCTKDKKEVRFPLIPMPGKKKLCWQVDQQVIETEVPAKYYTLLMKRPAAASSLGKVEKKEEEMKEKEEEEEDSDSGEEGEEENPESGEEDEGEEEESQVDDDKEEEEKEALKKGGKGANKEEGGWRRINNWQSKGCEEEASIQD